MEKQKFEEINVGADASSQGGVLGIRTPYAMAFVYSPQGNFVVKGNESRVRQRINERFPLCFYNIIQFRKRRPFPSILDSLRQRGNWEANGYLLHRQYHKGRRYWAFVDRKKSITVARFRRLPNAWPEHLGADIDFQLLVGADYAEEHGWLQLAEFVRNKIKEELKPTRQLNW